MHPWSLLETLSPVAPTSLPAPRWTSGRLLYEGREPYLASLYLGAATAALVLAALLGRRRPYRWPLAATAAALVVLSLGWYTPFGRAVTALPLLDTFRFPVKAMVPAALALALLAGMGFESLREEVGRPGWRRALVVCLLVVLALALAGAAWLALARADDWGSAVLEWKKGRTLADAADPAGLRLAGSAAALAACAAAIALVPASGRGRRMAAGLVAALAVADLVRAHDDLNPLAPPDFFAYRSPLLPLMPLAPGERLFVFDYTTPGAAARFLGHRAPFIARDEESTIWRQAQWVREYPMAEVPSAWDIETAFDRDAIDLYPVWTNGLFRLRGITEGSPAHLRILQMAGVRYVTTLHRENFGDLSFRAELPGHFAEPILLFEVPEPLPRARVVSGVRVGARPRGAGGPERSVLRSRA